MINIKDKKLKELEIEARNELNNLTSVMEEYDRKIDEMKNRESKLIEELNNYKENPNKVRKNYLNSNNSLAPKNNPNTERDILTKLFPINPNYL